MAKQRLYCAKADCTEDMTYMSFNDIIMHDISVHGDDFLKSCLTTEVKDEPETPQEVLVALKVNPGMVYVVHGQQAMYTQYGENVMLCFIGDFKGMNDEQINKFLQDSLKAAQDG